MKIQVVRRHIAPNIRPFDFIKNLTRESISAVSSRFVKII